jgi:hypothetical protein
MKLFITQQLNFFLVPIGIVIVSRSLVCLLTAGNTSPGSFSVQGLQAATMIHHYFSSLRS